MLDEMCAELGGRASDTSERTFDLDVVTVMCSDIIALSRTSQNCNKVYGNSLDFSEIT